MIAPNPTYLLLSLSLSVCLSVCLCVRICPATQLSVVLAINAAVPSFSHPFCCYHQVDAEDKCAAMSMTSIPHIGMGTARERLAAAKYQPWAQCLIPGHGAHMRVHDYVYACAYIVRYCPCVGGDRD